jgi:hypothetical protein
MPRPHVTTRCVADAYTDKARERIVEFGTTGQTGGGGLIAIRNHPDGTTSVSVYRCDPDVVVCAGDQQIRPNG